MPITNSSRWKSPFKEWRSLKKITPANYRQDPHYGRIVKATEDLLRERGFVAPVELFVRMGLLSADSVEDWRRGRIPYLERVVRCNLSKASRILRILRLHAHALDLKERPSVYMRWTKSPRTLLRFSKTRDRGVEDAYACHFLYQGEGGECARKQLNSLNSGPQPTVSPQRSPTGTKKRSPPTSKNCVVVGRALSSGMIVLDANILIRALLACPGTH